MDFATIRPALKSLVASVTGLDAAVIGWQSMGEVFASTAVRLHLRSAVGKGDEFRYAYDGTLLNETLRGERTLVFSVTVESTSHLDDGFALHHIERLRNRLRWESSRLQLEAALLSIAKIESAVEVPFSDGDHHWSAYQLDVRFNAVAAEQTDYDGAWIGEVAIDGELEGGASGDPLALDLSVFEEHFSPGFSSGYRRFVQ